MVSVDFDRNILSFWKKKKKGKLTWSASYHHKMVFNAETYRGLMGWDGPLNASLLRASWRMDLHVQILHLNKLVKHVFF